MTKKKPASKPAEQSPAEKQRLDDELDEALRDTFPASDPVKLTQPDPHPEPKPKD